MTVAFRVVGTTPFSTQSIMTYAQLLTEGNNDLLISRSILGKVKLF